LEEYTRALTIRTSVFGLTHFETCSTFLSSVRILGIHTCISADDESTLTVVLASSLQALDCCAVFTSYLSAKHVELVLAWSVALLRRERYLDAATFLQEQAHSLLTLWCSKGGCGGNPCIPLWRRALAICQWCGDDAEKVAMLTVELQVRHALAQAYVQQGALLLARDTLDVQCDDLTTLASSSSDAKVTLDGLYAQIQVQLQRQCTLLQLDVFAQLQRLEEGLCSLTCFMSLESYV
jgi:hypothetical protein